MQLSEIKILFAKHAQKKNEYNAARKDENSTVGLLNSLKQEMSDLDKKLYTLAADLFHKFQNFILKNPDLYGNFYPSLHNGTIESFKLKESKNALLINYSRTYESYPSYYSLLIPYEFLTDVDSFIITRKRYVHNYKIKQLTKELESIPVKITELKQHEQTLLLKRDELLKELIKI